MTLTLMLTKIMLGIMPPPRHTPVLSYAGQSGLALFDIVYGALLLWGLLTVGIELCMRKPPQPPQPPDEEEEAEVPGERR